MKRRTTEKENLTERVNSSAKKTKKKNRHKKHEVLTEKPTSLQFGKVSPKFSRFPLKRRISGKENSEERVKSLAEKPKKKNPHKKQKVQIEKPTSSQTETSEDPGEDPLLKSTFKVTDGLTGISSIVETSLSGNSSVRKSLSKKKLTLKKENLCKKLKVLEENATCSHEEPSRNSVNDSLLDVCTSSEASTLAPSLTTGNNGDVEKSRPACRRKRKLSFQGMLPSEEALKHYEDEKRLKLESYNLDDDSDMDETYRPENDPLETSSEWSDSDISLPRLSKPQNGSYQFNPKNQHKVNIAQPESESIKPHEHQTSPNSQSWKQRDNFLKKYKIPPSLLQRGKLLKLMRISYA